MAWEPDGELRRILDEHGFVRERQNKHQVWKNPIGQTFVCASTPSDVRAYPNLLAKLRRMLNLRTERIDKGMRRERKPKRRRENKGFQADMTIRSRPTMREQLLVIKSNPHERGVDRASGLT